MDKREEKGSWQKVMSFLKKRILVTLLVSAILFGISVLYRHHQRPSETARELKPVSGNWCYAGQPKPSSKFQYTISVVTNIGYLVGYCNERKDPVWVCYRLFKVTNLDAPIRPEEFYPDARTTTEIVQQDYRGGGFDRGHLAPNYAIAVCYGREAQKETFLMSNVIPQSPNLNRKIWRNIENKEIVDYAQEFGNIWVVTGPIFDKHSLDLHNEIDIPVSCYKIIVREENSKPKILAFIVPQNVNGDEPISQFLTNVVGIEQATGIKFFPDTKHNLSVYSSVSKEVWN